MTTFGSTSTSSRQAQWGIVLGVLVLVALHLGWEATHGGVVSHHFLARADMPAMSNWWGVLLVPALALWAAGQVLRRPARPGQGDGVSGKILRALPAFLGALIYGGALATSFVLDFGWEPYLFLSLFLIGLLLPIHRGEYVLGFVLGMMIVFGGVLSLMAAAIVATFSWLAHALWRALARLTKGSPRG